MYFIWTKTVNLWSFCVVVLLKQKSYRFFILSQRTVLLELVILYIFYINNLIKKNFLKFEKINEYISLYNILRNFPNENTMRYIQWKKMIFWFPLILHKIEDFGMPQKCLKNCLIKYFYNFNIYYVRFYKTFQKWFYFVTSIQILDRLIN